MEYEAISQALQMLWDEQLLGNRQRPPQHLNYHEADLNYQDAWDQDWEPWDPSDEGWADNAWTQSGWEEDPESWSSPAVPELPDEALSAEEQDKLRDAMQAERAAEQMAMDAQRTWTEAQRATQLVRKDRGFGASFSNSGKGNSSGGKGSGCFLCGGRHYARDCPDRRHPSKGKGKHAFMLADPYNEHFFTGKSGKKGKGWKGRSKSAAWADHRPTVNAYVQDMYGINGLEMHEGPHNPLELSSVSPGKVAPHQGMLDCGATASAGPEASVQRLIEAVLRQDKSATVTVDPNQRPYFRYGSGRWGRAQYRVTLQSELSGHPRVFHVYALPNPPEFFEQWFTTDMLVPILVGMSHAGSDGVGMVVDLATSFAIDALLPDPRPYQLDKNHKGHFMVDKVTSWTPTSTTGKPWDMHTLFPCEMYDMNVKVGTCSRVDPPVNFFAPHGPSRVCELYAWKLMKEHQTVPAWLISALDSSESMCSLPIRLRHLRAMSKKLTNPLDVTPTTAELPENLTSKKKTSKAPMPFDPEKSMEMDPRDIRAKNTWPCFNRHQPGNWASNPHGRWLHCQVCDLRLQYIPRQGSPSMSTMVPNHVMVHRAMVELQQLLPGRMPTAQICKAMLDKLVAEEKLLVMIHKVKDQPVSSTNKTSPAPPKRTNHKETPKTAAGYASPSPSMASSHSWEKPQMDTMDILRYLSTEEQTKLMEVVTERQQAAADQFSEEEEQLQEVA